ncbi:MAG: response regulator [Rhodothermales bacterium]|nr:response regulator [Rhodothermales bacterium]
MASSLRILVVEDDRVNLLVITRMLRRLGYDADVAHNGIEAVEAASGTAFDIIFMDVMMPELDGLGATVRIRERGDCGNPRIIAVTANAMAEDRTAALEAGMDEYVTKPIRLDVIRDVLERFSETAQQPEEAGKAEVAMLDTAVLDNLREMMGDESYFRELVAEFVENTETLVNDMAEGLSSEDWGSVQRAAHSLRSTSATFGGMRLADCSHAAEETAKQGAGDRMPSLLTDLRRERNRLCSRLLSGC